MERSIQSQDRAMKPSLDEIFLPCGWFTEAFREDRIAFTRGEDRLTLLAEPADESPAMPELCASRLWQLAYEQRAGEAKSDVTVGYVPTMDMAVETLLEHMRRINEIAGSDGSISRERLLELFEDESTIDDHDEWGRTSSDRIGPQPLP